MAKTLNGSYYNYLFVSSHILSFAPIYVFNWDDINMTFNYFTIKGIDEKSNIKLLPYQNEQGQRLEWHKSDRVYFGNSLKYRRTKNINGKLLPISKKDLKYICDALTWGNKFYKYDLFKLDFYKIKKPEKENKTYKYFRSKNIGSIKINFKKRCLNK